MKEVAREGAGVRVRIHNAYAPALNAAVSLAVGGVLVTPEHEVARWSQGATMDFTWPDADGTDAVLTLRYVRPDYSQHEERFPLRLPPAPEPAKVGVVDVAYDDGATVTVTVENVGAIASGPAVVGLAEPGKGRVGDPLRRAVSALAPGARAQVSFELPQRLATLRVVVEHDGRTHETDVSPRAPAAADVEVVGASMRNGTAELTLANVGGSSTGPLRVALEDLDGVRVGSPLTRTLPDLAPHARAVVTFRVPASTDRVNVALDYGGATHEVGIALDDADGDGTLELATDIPAREGEPGGSVAYTLTLKNDGVERLAALKAEGLPEGYDVRFAIDGSAASTVLVPANAERRVSATVRIPEGAGREAGATLPFRVSALVDGEEVAAAELALTVQGKGKLEVQGRNWFATLAPAATEEVTVTLRNTGSAPLHDVTPASTAPTGWRVTFSPSSIPRLDPGESADVVATIEAPADAGSGRYVLDVAAAAGDVTARARSLSVEIREEGGSSLGWLVGAGLAGLVAVALVVKLRRR